MTGTIATTIVLDPRQIFSDLVDCARHPSRYHIVCIGIEVRFHETKHA
jgi:hypothetical protein